MSDPTALDRLLVEKDGVTMDPISDERLRELIAWLDDCAGRVTTALVLTRDAIPKLRQVADGLRELLALRAAGGEAVDRAIVQERLSIRTALFSLCKNKDRGPA